MGKCLRERASKPHAVPRLRAERGAGLQRVLRCFVSEDAERRVVPIERRGLDGESGGPCRAGLLLNFGRLSERRLRPADRARESPGDAVRLAAAAVASEVCVSPGSFASLDDVAPSIALFLATNARDQLVVSVEAGGEALVEVLSSCGVDARVEASFEAETYYDAVSGADLRDRYLRTRWRSSSPRCISRSATRSRR